MTAHTVTWHIEGDHIWADFACVAGPEADCRLEPDCDCEDWTVERDDGGAYHMVEVLGAGEEEPTPERHDMKPGPDCNVVNWLYETGASDSHDEDANEEITTGPAPIRTSWTGDYFTWRYE